MLKGLDRVMVIGVGASAGGLDALIRFFAATEADVGAAFIVVQHLDPTQKSIMASLIGRETPLEVIEARNAELIKANTVYTTPPGKYVTVVDGQLVLEEPKEARYHRTPIDHLFRGLAESYGPKSAGIVLSGTGSDGSKGLAAIKAQQGMTFVQAPSDAEFDGMPRSAIESGSADIVASADDLPNRLRQRLGLVVRNPSPSEDRADGLAEVLDVLSICNGFDFFEYKTSTLSRRVRRRMARTQIEIVAEYVDYLKRKPEERETLINDLLIGVTSFFRDTEAWEEFATLAIDPTIERLPEGATLRAWAAGCASGEEAYTLAIALIERIERLRARISIQVFGTDLNPNAIETARAGAYSLSSVSGISPERVARWFVKEDGHVRVISSLREKVVFATQNAVNDPPFSSLDLITCRNLLIYLDNQAQDRLMELFHFSLSEKGFLMLGSAESAARSQDAFSAISNKHRIYQRKEGRARLLPSRPATRRETAQQPQGRTETVIRADVATGAMLSRFVPPAILLKENFDIAGMHGDLGDYMKFRRAGLTSSVLNIIADPYQVQVWKAVQSAKRDNGPSEALVNPVEPGQVRTRILAEPVNVDARREFLVYFIRDEKQQAADPEEFAVPGFAETDEEIGSYRSEVQMLRQELQAVIDRSERSNEELQAANEEVMSANEELQSSNEELETSREELQSLNQELKSINHELEEKVTELETTNDDLANLIRSTDIATIFLDTELNIRRFSERATDLMSIRDEDVGRPISELALKVDDPDLARDVRRVLANLETIEVKVESELKAYLRRITPFRTHANLIQGAIVTYADVTVVSQTAEKLAQQARRQAIVADLGELALSSPDDVVLFDRAAQGLAEGVGAALAAVQRYDAETSSFCLVAGAGRAARFTGSWTADARRNELGLAFRLHGPLVTADVSSETRFRPSQLLKDAEVRAGVCATIGPLFNPWGIVEAWWTDAGKPDEEVVNYVTAFANVLSLAILQAEARSLRENEREVLQSLVDGLPILFGVVDDRMRFELFNRAFEEIGWIPDETKGASVLDVLGGEAADAAREVLRGAENDATFPKEIQLRFPGDEQRTHLLYCVPRGGKDRVTGAYLAVLDIHERKLWEERNRVISAELDHRVKNILALVSTIARMTARHAPDFDDFKKVLSDRIDSLARTHARLAAKSWSGMELQALIEDELAAYAPPDESRYTVSGGSVSVGTRATQSLSMVFHELTTNAVKYGALSKSKGRLEIFWRIEKEKLELTWRESGIGPLKEPDRKGFGSTVIENAIQRQLFGEIERTYTTHEVNYVMSIPMAKLSENEHAHEY
ncbi:MAG: chemotaxis protein CheB [Pseudomonadota bacterium]